MSPEAHSASLQRSLKALLGQFNPVAWSVIERRPWSAAARGMRAEELILSGEGRPTVRAFLTGPEGLWCRLPAVIYCHAHGNRYDIGATELLDGRPALSDPPYSQALAAAGIVAICIDLPVFGARAFETESAVAKRHLWRGTSLFGAMLEELAGLQGLLGKTDGVDPDRIGAMGISMGGTLAFWLTALERDIKAVAHLCCFADLDALVSAGAHDLHGIYMTVPNLLQHASTGAIAGLVAPRPQLICTGADDPLTPDAAFAIAMADVRTAYARADVTDALDMLRAPGTGHRETQDMRDRVIAFLVANL